jgi:hypothetical protein
MNFETFSKKLLLTTLFGENKIMYFSGSPYCVALSPQYS